VYINGSGIHNREYIILQLRWIEKFIIIGS